jgi:hypothetical protein
LGNRPAAEKAYAELVEAMGEAALYQHAKILAQWGKPDEAVAKLWGARQVGDSGLTNLATDPLLDPIRQHPEFIKLLNELRMA